MKGVSLEGPAESTVEQRPWRLLADAPGDLRARVPHPDGLTPEGGLAGCLACGHPELYQQRAFPRTLGITVVVVAAVLAPFTWYLSLGVAALLDALLYACAPRLVVCYVCSTAHRGFAAEPRHPRYDLGIAERLRYGSKAVMGTPMRPGGTAGAPEPEH